MNTTPDDPPPLPRPPLPARPRPHDLVPMEAGTGVASSIASLLKSPGSILYELTTGTRAAWLAGSLGIITILGLLVFGLVTGSVSGGDQWWAAPAKITGGLLFAAIICLPSLYIFSALSGIALRLHAIAGILLSTTGLTALLLAGFTPLVWVFGQSTGSICFIGGLLIVIWLFSILFGMNLLVKCSRSLGMTNALHLGIWCFMFLLVTLQVSCALRPIVGTADTFLPPSDEKKFFLQHWADNLKSESSRKPATASNSSAEKD